MSCWQSISTENFLVISPPDEESSPQFDSWVKIELHKWVKMWFGWHLFICPFSAPVICPHRDNCYSIWRIYSAQSTKQTPYNHQRHKRPFYYIQVTWDRVEFFLNTLLCIYLYTSCCQVNHCNTSRHLKTSIALHAVAEGENLTLIRQTLLYDQASRTQHRNL